MIDLPVTKLAFTSRPLKSSKKWWLDLVWPDGRAEHVQDFESEAEAKAWIENKSQFWLRKQLDLR